VVLYGCETWSLTLREEHSLRVCENRTLRWIFGLKRDEVTGGWRKLHNDELCNVYSLPRIISIIKWLRMRLVEHVARLREKMNTYRILVGKPEGERPLWRPRHWWVDNIVICMSVTIEGVWMVIEFTVLIRNITTINYSSLTISHTLQFTTACTKSSQYAVSSPDFW
jgi:hypothetical protein